MEEMGLIELNNGGMGSFVHSTREAMLRLDVLQGLSEYNEELVKLQVGETQELKLKPYQDYDFNRTDILVVEISTIKVISSMGNPLQFNEVNRHLCTPYGEFGIELRRNINHAFNDRKSFVSVPEVDIPEGFPTDYIGLISTLEPQVLNEVSIFSDLKQLIETAGVPVLLVNHINLPGKDGKKISSRNRLCKMMNNYGKENRISVFNPEVMFENHRREDLLMKDGEDLNHYAKNKLDIVGLKLMESINSVLAGN
tara:strand:+ start:182 stop:943 length:762 start_codon:yes stop_codon:yes gene_type:complete